MLVCIMIIVDRHRKMKERLGLTEMRKAANRVIFGEVRIVIFSVNFCNFLLLFATCLIVLLWILAVANC